MRRTFLGLVECIVWQFALSLRGLDECKTTGISQAEVDPAGDIPNELGFTAMEEKTSGIAQAEVDPAGDIPNELGFTAIEEKTSAIAQAEVAPSGYIPNKLGLSAMEEGELVKDANDAEEDGEGEATADAAAGPKLEPAKSAFMRDDDLTELAKSANDAAEAKPESARETGEAQDFASQTQSFMSISHNSSDDPPHIAYVPCPVISSMYREGWLKPDKFGRVTSYELQTALQKTGTDLAPAFFQAFGIAVYKKHDRHQTERDPSILQNLIYHSLARLTNSVVKSNRVNIFTMQMEAACKDKNLNGAGKPCNLNPQNQQHGYSTLLRDARHPDFEATFEDWFGPVLEERQNSSWGSLRRARDGDRGGKLRINGFIKMMQRARRSGDFSGEFSIGFGRPEDDKSKKYHPQVTDTKARLVLSAWQPIFAWTLFWTLFSRKDDRSGPYFEEQDLRDFFITGKFPNWWQIDLKRGNLKPAGGFTDVVDFFLKYLEKQAPGENDGLGDEWMAEAKVCQQRAGGTLPQWRCFQDISGVLGAQGMFKDDVANPKPALLSLAT